MTITQKICSKCQIFKDLSEYYKQNRSKDGLQSRCKDCDKLGRRRKDFVVKVSLKSLSPAELRKHKAESYRKYLNGNPQRRIKANLRSRLSQFVSGYNRDSSAVRDLGCSWEEFKIHLESKFQEGMSWDNYGKWHIDHIIPLSSFNISLLKGACHYTNLQPLWAKDNIKKSNKF